MSNHTPGEWTVSKNLAGDPVVASTNHHDNDGYIICLTFGRHRHGNAALIAAAPDLLVALKELLPMAARSIQGTTNGEPILQAARAAIAKATGEVKEES